MFWYWSGYFQFQWGNGTKKIKNLAQGGSFYSLKDALAPGFWADSIPGQAGTTPGPRCSFGKFLLNLGKSSLLPAFPMASQRVWGQWHLPSLQKGLPRSEGAFWIFWRRIPPKTNSGAQHPRSQHWHGKIKPLPKIPWIHPTAPHNWEQSWAGEVFILNSSRTGCFGELVCFIINIFPLKLWNCLFHFKLFLHPGLQKEQWFFNVEISCTGSFCPLSQIPFFCFLKIYLSILFLAHLMSYTTTYRRGDVTSSLKTLQKGPGSSQSSFISITLIYLAHPMIYCRLWFMLEAFLNSFCSASFFFFLGSLLKSRHTQPLLFSILIFANFQGLNHL